MTLGRPSATACVRFVDAMTTPKTMTARSVADTKPVDMCDLRLPETMRLGGQRTVDDNKECGPRGARKN
jgi:hypothetical protein